MKLRVFVKFSNIRNPPLDFGSYNAVELLTSRRQFNDFTKRVLDHISENPEVQVEFKIINQPNTKERVYP